LREGGGNARDGRAEAKMIDETLTRIFVACGWITAVIAGFFTMLCVMTGCFGLNKYNIVDMALLFGLAYGVYRRSRTCAVLLLAYDVASQAMLLSRGRQPSVIALISAGTFFTAYALGVIGTFVSHAHAAKAAVASSGD
jgi:hypothetical protein